MQKRDAEGAYVRTMPGYAPKHQEQTSVPSVAVLELLWAGSSHSEHRAADASFSPRAQ